MPKEIKYIVTRDGNPISKVFNDRSVANTWASMNYDIDNEQIAIEEITEEIIKEEESAIDESIAFYEHNLETHIEKLCELMKEFAKISYQTSLKLSDMTERYMEIVSDIEYNKERIKDLKEELSKYK